MFFSHKKKISLPPILGTIVVINYLYDSPFVLPVTDEPVCVLAPQEIAGHTSAIKKALWCNDDKQILSAAEDKTIR